MAAMRSPEQFRGERFRTVSFPSHGGEGVPRVLIEGAACGRALVATNVRGCREIVRPGENGRLVPPRDPRALADAIQALLADPVERARMGERGRAITIGEFSLQRVLDDTLAVQREAERSAD